MAYVPPLQRKENKDSQSASQKYVSPLERRLKSKYPDQNTSTAYVTENITENPAIKANVQENKHSRFTADELKQYASANKSVTQTPTPAQTNPQASTPAQTQTQYTPTQSTPTESAPTQSTTESVKASTQAKASVPGKINLAMLNNPNQVVVSKPKVDLTKASNLPNDYAKSNTFGNRQFTLSNNAVTEKPYTYDLNGNPIYRSWETADALPINPSDTRIEQAAKNFANAVIKAEYGLASKASNASDVAGEHLGSALTGQQANPEITTGNKIDDAVLGFWGGAVEPYVLPGSAGDGASAYRAGAKYIPNALLKSKGKGALSTMAKGMVTGAIESVPFTAQQLMMDKNATPAQAAMNAALNTTIGMAAEPALAGLGALGKKIFGKSKTELPKVAETISNEGTGTKYTLGKTKGTFKKATKQPAEIGSNPFETTNVETQIPLTPKPIETVDPAPIRPLGAGWTADRGAMPGEPILEYKGQGAIIEVADDNGNVLYQAALDGGEDLGLHQTVEGAGKAVQDAVDGVKPIESKPAVQTAETVTETPASSASQVVDSEGLTQKQNDAINVILNAGEKSSIDDYTIIKNKNGIIYFFRKGAKDNIDRLSIHPNGYYTNGIWTYKDFDGKLDRVRAVLPGERNKYGDIRIASSELTDLSANKSPKAEPPAPAETVAETPKVEPIVAEEPTSLQPTTAEEKKTVKKFSEVLPETESGLNDTISGLKKEIASETDEARKVKLKLQLFAAEEKLKSISQFKVNTINRNPQMPESVKSATTDEMFGYQGEKSSEWQANAEENVANNREKVIADIENANAIAGGTQAHEAAIITNELVAEAKSTGDASKLIKWLKTVAAKTREAARTLTGTRTAWDRTTPEGALMDASRAVDGAERDLAKTNPKKIKQIDDQTKAATDAVNKAHDEAVTEAVDEVVTGKKKSSGTGKKSKGKPSNKAKAETEEPDPAELLASKIKSTLKPKTVAEETMIDKMVKELYAVAKESPLGESNPLKKNPLRKVSEAIKNRGLYTDTWNRAKEIVMEQFKDNPEALAVLEDYFNKGIRPPYSMKSFNSAFSNGMKELGFNMSEIVKKYYTVGTQDKEGLINYLVSKSGLSGDDAKALANAIDSKYHQLKKEKAEEYLAGVFGISKSKLKNRLAKAGTDIEALANTGGLENQKYVDQVMGKLDSKLKTIIKELGIDINKLVREGYPKTELERDKFVKDLAEQMQVGDKDLRTILDEAIKLFDDMSDTQRDSILSGMFRDVAAAPGKTVAESIQELSNLGAFRNPKYIDKVLAKVSSKVRTLIKEKGINLGELVRQGYKKTGQERDAIVANLAKQLNVPEKDLKEVMDATISEFDRLAEARRESILSGMFRESSKGAGKTVDESIQELANLGAFSNDKYKGKVLDKLSSKVRALIKEKGIDLNELVRQGYKKTGQERDQLVADLAKKLNLSEADMKTVMDATMSEFDKLAEAKRAQILNNMLVPKTLAKTTKKNIVDKVMELINLGAYDDDAMRDLIKAKEGLPVLSNEDVKAITHFMDMANSTKDKRLQAIFRARAHELIEIKSPSSFTSKSRTLKNILLLANVPTAMTNSIANAAFGIVDNVANVIGGTLLRPLDKALSKKSGLLSTRVTNPLVSLKGFGKGTSDLISDSLGGFIPSEYKNKSAWEKVKYLFDQLSNPIDTSPVQADKFEGGRKLAFKNKPMRIIENLASIFWTDRPFERMHYDDILNQLKKANGVTEATDDMIEQARLIAEERTFKDTNTISTIALGLKNLPTGQQKEMSSFAAQLVQFLLFDTLIPFAKTPANLIKRGMELTPYGIAEGLFRLVKSARQVDLPVAEQAKIINRISRGLVGSGIIAGGVAAQRAGIATGKKDKDADVTAFEGVVNRPANAVMVNGKYYPYGNYQPAAAPFGMGVQFGERMAESEKNKDDNNTSWFASAVLNNSISAIDNALNYYSDQPMLKSIQTLVGTQNDNRSIGEKVGDALMLLPQQYTPSVLKQVRQSQDDNKRELYTNDAMTKGVINPVKDRIPGMSTSLPVKRDVEGKDALQFQGKNSLLNIMFNPFKPYNFNPTSVEKEILRLYDEGGQKVQVPTVAEKKFTFSKDKQEYVMNGEEYSRYQQVLGQETMKSYEKAMNSKEYKELGTDEKKASMLSALISEARIKAQYDYLKTKGVVSIPEIMEVDTSLTKDKVKKDLTFEQQKEWAQILRSEKAKYKNVYPNWSEEKIREKASDSARTKMKAKVF